MKNILIVDYENQRDLSLESLDPEILEVWFFVGKTQNKLPFELVASTQHFGNSLRWIKIEGDGKNNLDFHIVFELGRLSTQINTVKEVFVLSRDKGFDAVIEYINRTGLNVKRVVNLSQLPSSEQIAPSSRHTEPVIANLSKISPSRRPRTRSSLATHLKNTFSGKIGPEDIETVIEELFIMGKISESGNRLTYDL